ncbi:beta strand repeat-containing protein [Mesorhizobium sophorae]|uniref:beta strand repeat-containing protein n=1 Tax=Mesorhizobium sophorae TaxID=1300294 RepID=UPI00142D1D0E|nr:hypothetical protein [Mesorhizobium sophorae]
MGNVFFAAQGDSGWGLYESDGTTSGTKLVHLYLNPFDSQASGIQQLFAIDGGAFVTDTNNIPITDFYSETAQLSASFQLGGQEKFSDGTRLYSHVYNGQDPGGNPNYIYASDGTVAGTKSLLNLPGTTANLFEFFTFNQSTYVQYDDVALNETFVYRLNANDSTLAFSFSSTGPNNSHGVASSFFQLGSKVIFTNQTGANGEEPWISDGTSQGTHLLLDVRPGAIGSMVTAGPNLSHAFVALGDKAFFVANDGTHGSELWVTDGTGPGTHLLVDTAPLGNDGVVAIEDRSAVVNGKFYFLQVKPGAFLGLTGYDFWRTDGTSAGTQAVSMTYMGHAIHAIPSDIGTLGNKIFFEGFQDSNQGMSALYTYDTQTGVTQLVKDIDTVSDFALNGSQYDNISGYTQLGNRLIFHATDFVGGDVNTNNRVVNDELWITDGTTAGTHKISEIQTGEQGSSPIFLTVVGDARTSGLDDVVHLSGNEHYIDGGAGSDTLYGTPLADTLIGGTGSDHLYGGAGDDTYFVDNAGDQVIEANGQGIDNVQAYVSFNLSGQELENLALRSAASINGTGNSTANIITGNSGNNIIDGLLGADTMSGAQGNDTYFVDNAGDHVIELNGQGTDTVNSSISFNLSGQELENLTLTGSANINGTGNQIDNILNGNAGVNTLIGLGGNDTLNGKEGADTMQGGIGNDTYFVDNAGDVVSESTAGADGNDIVNSYISISLSDGNHFTGNIENVALRSAASINATGNSLANALNGNSGVNTLIGLGGNDTLDGKEGADTMQGGIGNDTYFVDNVGDIVSESTAGADGSDIVNGYISINLSDGNHFTGNIENVALRSAASINATGNSIANIITGNSGDNVINGLGGNDTLSGAQGQDSFVFTTALNDVTNVDHIIDFSMADDTIEVDNAIFAALGGNGTLTADQFVANASGAATTANQHIIYETDTGWLYYDSDGSAAGGSTHFATLAANLALTNADFVVV